LNQMNPVERSTRLDLGGSASWLTEPRWQPARAGAAPWPAGLGAWLLDQGSLTAKLVAASGGDFEVQVCFQGVASPKPSERKLLGLGRGHWALVREVVLRGRGEPWVFARSLIPLTSLTGRLRQLRRFDSRPLGAFLFAQPDLQRGTMEVSRIGPGRAYVPPDLQGRAHLWGRRSVFRLEGRPLLVSEVFLPRFVQSSGLQNS